MPVVCPSIAVGLVYLDVTARREIRPSNVVGDRTR